MFSAVRIKDRNNRALRKNSAVINGHFISSITHNPIHSHRWAAGEYEK